MKVVDLTYLRSIADDASTIASFMSIFNEQLVEFEIALDEEFSRRNWRRVSEIAHKAKSSIVSMGMQELAESMKRLEMLAKQLYVELPLALPNIVETYKAQLDGLPDDFKQWINNNKTLDAVEQLVNFYKSQAKLAKADLVEFFESKCN